MKIAIMQPYLFPYIGYFQLINSVDEFVIFDDVNFIKKGWINRNRILVNNSQEYLFTLPLEKASQNSLIKDIKIFEPRKSKEALLKTIFSSYKKAPYFSEVAPLIEKIILNEEENLSRYIADSLREISKYLGIKTKFIFSSEIDYDRLGDGQDKIISIIKKRGANSYFNLPGGVELYDEKVFADQKISLNFIKPVKLTYKQFGENFLPYLSIIDVMMFVSRQEIQGFISASA